MANKFGNKNRIKNSNIAGNDINITSEEEKKPFINKILMPLIVTVVGGVIVGVILYFVLWNRNNDIFLLEVW